MAPVQTSISQVFPDRILIRGYSLADLIGVYGFGDVVYLLLVGELPTGHEGGLIDAILVACVEHNINAPSTHTARVVANTGTSLQSAVAAGISAIGEHHGGAGEACARILQEALLTDPTAELDVLAGRIVADARHDGRRLPGFGHRFHDPDPRAERLLGLADQWSLSGRHVSLARAIEGALRSATGRSLPINVDGALAALISDLGIDWRHGKSLFLIGRSAGLVAHAYEETGTGKPFQFAERVDVSYIGPGERSVPAHPGD
ncbi:MAG: citryl-CoA lyase [Chloroflexota bacterium]|nr:citryl-CoA lyase [Chloroflexota bacterium]